MELIYLACPFRHREFNIMKKRCAAAHFVAAELTSLGLFVFSPLTHNEILIDLCEDEVPKEHWMEFDLTILSICKKLIIIKMEGWDISKGVQREMLFAKNKKIPIEKIDPPEEMKFIHLVRTVQKNTAIV